MKTQTSASSGEEIDQRSAPIVRIPRRKFHLFLPATADKDAFLTWLLRTHAWFGLWGAVLGMMFAVTGILLNHGILGSFEHRTYQVPVPQPSPANQAEFNGWFLKEFNVSRIYISHESAPYKTKTGESSQSPGSRSVVVNGRAIPQPEVWRARSRTPSIYLDVKYRPGDTFATVQRDTRGITNIFNQLHLQNGTNIWFVLLTDTAAGALIMLSITGLLLWSRLHGSRLVALFLLLFPVLLAVVFVVFMDPSRR